MRTLVLIGLFVLAIASATAQIHPDTVTIPVEDLKNEIAAQLANAKELGFWNAEVRIISEVNKEGLISLQIDRGTAVNIENIRFTPVSEREAGYLFRETSRKEGGDPSTDLAHIKSRLTMLGYEYLTPPKVSIDNRGRHHVDFLLVKKPSLKVDALAAFSQNANSDTLSFFGHLDLIIPNLDGRGKSLRLHWKRLAVDSELLDLSYRHPWLLSSPIALNAGLNREVVTGDYQTLDTRIGIEWSLDWDQSLLLSLEDHQALITFEGRTKNPDWRPLRRQSFGMGYRQMGLERGSLNGLNLITSLYQELEFEANSVTRWVFRSELHKSIVQGAWLSQRSAVTIQSNVNELTDPTRLKPIGGLHSVRGYQEQYARSSSVATLQHDLNIKLGKQSQVFALIDLGLFREGEGVSEIVGYGFGVQLRSGRGPLRIILATHPDLSLQNSFLHIQFVGDVNWIDR